jgi:hypothetical protein
MVTVFGTLQAILFAQILPAMKSFMMLILSINPIILSLVVASGLIIAKLYEWDTAQQATNKSIESSLQLQTKLKNKVVEGVAIWKQYGAASKEALIQSGITAEQAKKAMEGMFSLSATLSGEDQAKWRARAELYKQVYQDLSSRANSSCAEMLALSGKELEGQRRNEAILKAEMDARRKEEIEAVKQTEAAKEQLRINYLSSIAQKIRLSLMDKQLVMQQERDFAIANAEEMGLSIDEINEYYAQKEYERRTQKLEQILAVTQQMTNQLGAVSSQYFQNKITELDNWATKEKDAVNNSQMSEEQKSAAIQRIDEKLATEKRKIAREQASMEKATSLASAIVNTAEAVVKALTAGPILGPILAGIIGSMGAAQVSLIASQPLPAFEFGGIVPGNSFVGDNMLAAVNSGEMILNRGQQATLFDIANGRGGAAGVTQSINVYLDRRAIASAVVADMPAILRLNGVCPI